MDRTLVLLKPDCVQRRLMGEIISRFETKGFNVIAMKMLQVTPELAKQHYAEHVEKPLVFLCVCIQSAQKPYFAIFC